MGADLSAELATATESYYTDVPPLTSDQPLAPSCREDGPLGPAVDAGDGYFPQLKPLP